MWEEDRERERVCIENTHERAVNQSERFIAFYIPLYSAISNRIHWLYASFVHLCRWSGTPLHIYRIVLLSKLQWIVYTCISLYSIYVGMRHMSASHMLTAGYATSNRYFVVRLRSVRQSVSQNKFTIDSPNAYTHSCHTNTYTC